MKNVIAALVMVLVGTSAHATTYQGTDEQGQNCVLDLQIKIGKTKHKDACFFEQDGEGPWCDGKPPVFFNSVIGQGRVILPDVTTSFKIDDEYSMVDEKGRTTMGQSSEANVYIRLDKKSIEVKYEILTAFGKSVGNVANYLMKHAGIDYEQAYHSVFQAKSCTVTK